MPPSPAERARDEAATVVTQYERGGLAGTVGGPPREQPIHCQERAGGRKCQRIPLVRQALEVVDARQ
jgi:hypothetical protein